VLQPLILSPKPLRKLKIKHQKQKIIMIMNLRESLAFLAVATILVSSTSSLGASATNFLSRRPSLNVPLEQNELAGDGEDGGEDSSLYGQQQDAHHQSLLSPSSPSSSPASPGARSPPTAPPLPEEIGRCTWSLLHTVAASYPERATEIEASSALSLLQALAVLYPCRRCADDWAYDLQHEAPQLDGRLAFSQWLCRAHNRVNKKLGKDDFDCSQEALDARWRRRRKKED